MRDIAFYQDHLDRVSRSFAFCIRELPPPMRGWVSLSYLLCRALDTIEDSAWRSHRARDAAFDAFDAFLLGGVDATAIARWAGTFPADLPTGERELLDDALSLFEDLAGLPSAPRHVIQDTVRSMSAGMRHYADQLAAEGELRLRDLREVNRYCYFVAGIVGQLLTRLFVLSHPQAPQVCQGQLRDAFHFGLFLQKINILKDQREDEALGRFLVPSRRKVMASLEENTRGSVAYLTALPVQAKGYRTFCAWALYLGLASLPYMEAAEASGLPVKIDRLATMQVLTSVSRMINDNEALRAGIEPYLQLLPRRRGRVRGAGDWFCNLAGNTLLPSELSELRVL